MADTAAMPKVTKADKGRDQKYMAEDDLRTLTRVAEIKADKPRYKRALKMARAQMAALKKLAGDS